jgi:hypothetical protein
VKSGSQIRAKIQPIAIPPKIRSGKSTSASRQVGLGTPSMTKVRKKLKRAMAAASFSRLSPSTMRVSRWGAAMLRKIETTAEGSVVATMAPSMRQAISGSGVKGFSVKPMTSVATTTASTAITRMGTQSSAMRRRFSPSEV